ncbi:MAG: hypothetical protein JWR07_3971 [Nevskia sp.]|nr:hypothetical protein [Nevskia sp.]
MMKPPMPRIRTHGELLLDAQHRQLILRGVNLGGDSKLPFPHGGTHFPSDFADHRDVSFIGRPFPLEEADTHFARLRHWGFNCLRLLTTWEAVEHTGPGIYDLAYLDYLEEIVRRAGEYGLYVFVDFHQDAWSRMSGGSGAPGWTFEAVGLDFRKFPQAGAAIVMQAAFDYANPDPHQASYPQMIWSSNYLAPANGILWTLFWGGRLMTPDFRVGGVNVQDFLQARLLGAMGQVAARLRDLPNVLGFDSLNEPSPGWLQSPLSGRRLQPGDPGLLPMKPGPAWSPLDALAVAQGLSVTMPTLGRDPATGRLRQAGEQTMNPDGVRIWRDDADCPFQVAGIYDIAGGRARSRREDAFVKVSDRPISIVDDAFGPWFHAVAGTMRAHQPEWLLFAELDAHAIVAGRQFPADAPSGLVNAGHWYDVAILYSKKFSRERVMAASQPGGPDGVAALAARYRAELSLYKQTSSAIGAGVPTLIGEFGVPFDLDRGQAYQDWARGERELVWADHVCALSLMYDAMDALGLHAMLWNYTASNRNDLRIGDGWNQEDLSIFSIDQVDDSRDPDSGGRAIAGFCRPYVRRAQGRLTRVAFDSPAQSFEAEIEADALIEGPTELYVPALYFPQGFQLRISGPGGIDARVEELGQIILITHTLSGICSITVSAET